MIWRAGAWGWGLWWAAATWTGLALGCGKAKDSTRAHFADPKKPENRTMFGMSGKESALLPKDKEQPKLPSGYADPPKAPPGKPKDAQSSPFTDVGPGS